MPIGTANFRFVIGLRQIRGCPLPCLTNVQPASRSKSRKGRSNCGATQAAAGASAPTPGYAPAAAYPAPSLNVYPDPPNLNWVLELLLGFLTCGLFVVVWNLIIASWSKRVQPASTALAYYIAATGLIVLNLGGSWGALFAFAHHQHHHQSIVSSLLSLASWIVRLVARFTLRDTLEQHFNGPEPLGLRMSAVMTFFFGGIYIQYKLNRINEIKEALRYSAVAR